jgi:hypothetical protein
MILTFRDEVTEPATKRLFVSINNWPKDDPRARDNGRHLAVIGFETPAGEPEDIVMVYPDTAEQRDRAQAIKAELLHTPWPRLGSRARVRVTVRVVERIVEACGWQLPENERHVLDGLRALG